MKAKMVQRNPDEWVTTEEARQILGIGKTALHRYAGRGRLTRHKYYNNGKKTHYTLFRRSEVEDLARERKSVPDQ